MGTATEACAAKTGSACNSLLKTPSYLQIATLSQYSDPDDFVLSLVESNKTEPIAVNFWQNKCVIRIEK